MTKSQLIEHIARRTPKVPRREIEAMVNTVFDSMIAALRREERIEIRGFGSFGVKERGAREGRNPKTGQRVSVPRRRTPFFTVGKELRERLNPESMEPASPEPASPGGFSSSTMPMAAAPSSPGRYRYDV